MATTWVVAHFEPADAAIIVAIISAFAAIVGPVALALVSSLKRIRQAAETAVHNTQSNGANDTPPSPYDALIASHEYAIGQIHAVAEEARSAARAAERAAIAARANDTKTDTKAAELAKKIDDGFADAKKERDAITERLDAAIDDGDRRAEQGRGFAAGIVAAALGPPFDLLGRLDAIDGQDSRAALRELLAGNVPAGDEPEPEPGD
jgi:hypothetical protein